MKNFARKKSGASLVELPATLWLLFIGLGIPLLLFLTLAVRATFFYFGVRDATYQASKQATFTDAQTTVGAVLKKDVTNSWNGITINNPPNLVVVVRDMKKNTTTEVKGPLGANSVNTNNNVYMLKAYATADIDPLLPIANFGIPGITGPYTVQFAYQVYMENPTGLES